MNKELQGKVTELRNRVGECNLRGIRTPKAINDKLFALDKLSAMPSNEFTLAQIQKNFETLSKLVETLEGKESKGDVSFVAGEKMLSDESLSKRAFSVVMKNYAIAQIQADSARRIAELNAKRENQIAKIPLAQKADFEKILNTIGANFTMEDIIQSELDSDE